MKKNKLPYYKPGFKVPEDYFDTLENRLMDSVKLINPERVEKVKSASPFKVPDNYFDSFDEKVLDKINQEEKSTKVIGLFSNRRSFYYVAAVAAVFIALITTTFFNPAQPVTIQSLESVALENYIIESLELSTTDIVEITDANENFSSQSTDIDEEAIIEYLQENIEETAIIFNEN